MARQSMAPSLRVARSRSASPALTIASSAPDASSPSGSSPSALHTARVSSYTGTASASARSVMLAAVASSYSAVASPPSVGSCISRGRADAHSACASRAMLMPGSKSMLRARSIVSALTPRFASWCDASRASSAVPSIAMPFVISTTSPGSMFSPRTISSRAASPSIAPTMIGRSRPIVISVCPPTSSISSASHADVIWLKIAAGRLSGAPGGSSAVARNHAGRAPMQAMSFALTCTAYQPICSAANVTGSVFATRQRPPPMSMTAASRPMPGPTRTRGSRCVIVPRSSASIAAGSLPGRSIIVAPRHARRRGP